MNRIHDLGTKIFLIKLNMYLQSISIVSYEFFNIKPQGKVGIQINLV